MAILDDVLSMRSTESKPCSHSETMDVFLNAATFPGNAGTGTDESMSYEDFRHWCSLVPSARKFLGSLLMPPKPGFMLLFSSSCPVTNLCLVWI